MLTNHTPAATTIAKWVPKCNTEGEIRIGIDFEMPLTDDVIQHTPHLVQKAAKTVKNQDNGCSEYPLDNEFLCTVEMYDTPDHNTPAHTLSSVMASRLIVWRPTPKDGTSNELFLSFHVDARAMGPEGGALATWLLPMQRKTAFILAMQVQGTLPGMGESKESTKPRGRKAGKDAAAGSDD